jgi:hypothetical protein
LSKFKRIVEEGESLRCYPKSKSKYYFNALDVCYHILDFYSNPIEFVTEGKTAKLVHPFTSSDYLSYGLSWLLYVNLKAIIDSEIDRQDINVEGYDMHMIRENIDKLRLLSYRFAEELEINGKWEWAIYVLLFEPDSHQRVLDILSRNIEETIDEVSSKQEFLEEKLGISSRLIESAKALKLEYRKDFASSILKYIKAELYLRAHDILLSETGPDFIIGYSGKELYTNLYQNILSCLEEYSYHIAPWSLSGKIYVDYCILSNTCADFSKLDYKDFEDNLHRIEELMLTIEHLPRNSLKQKAAISIMQTQLSKWYYEIQMLQQQGEDRKRFSRLAGCGNMDRGCLLRMLERESELLLKNRY